MNCIIFTLCEILQVVGNAFLLRSKRNNSQRKPERLSCQTCRSIVFLQCFFYRHKTSKRKRWWQKSSTLNFRLEIDVLFIMNKEHGNSRAQHKNPR